MIKKMTTVMLLLAALCMTLAGCGKQPGNEFVGTWENETVYSGENCETFYVIEKAQNGDTAYIVTWYELDIDRMKKAVSGKIVLASSKKQFPAHYKDGILKRDSSKKFYLENGKLREGNSEQVYERVSDKSMTFDEMNNGRGYPEPK